MTLTRFFQSTLVALAFVTAAAVGACGSDKVCTTEQVQSCDAQLDTCIAKSPCNDATDPGYQACVNDCQSAHCACLDACGTSCSR